MRNLFPSLSGGSPYQCGGHHVAALGLNVTLCHYSDTLYSWGIMQREILGVGGSVEHHTPGFLARRPAFRGGAAARRDALVLIAFGLHHPKLSRIRHLEGRGSVSTWAAGDPDDPTGFLRSPVFQPLVEHYCAPPALPQHARVPPREDAAPHGRCRRYGRHISR